MRLPRDVSGQQLTAALGALGYSVTRQKGDHLRLTTQQEGQHHLSIPLHNPLRIGTFANALSDVAAHFGLTRDELLVRLDL